MITGIQLIIDSKYQVVITGQQLLSIAYRQKMLTKKIIMGEILEAVVCNCYQNIDNIDSIMKVHVDCSWDANCTLRQDLSQIGPILMQQFRVVFDNKLDV